MADESAVLESATQAISIPVEVRQSPRAPLLEAFPNLAKRLDANSAGAIEALDGRVNCVVSDGEVHNLYSLIVQRMYGKKIPEEFTYTAVREHYGLK